MEKLLNRLTLVALTLIFSFTLSVVACSKSDSDDTIQDCQKNASLRRGAVCKDGTQTTATGSGACSGHGGVDYWLCK